MKRFVEGVDRGQVTLFPDRLEDWIGDDNPVRVIDVFVDQLDLGGLGFDRVDEHWRVTLAGDNRLLILDLTKRGYFDVLKRRGAGRIPPCGDNWK